MKVINNKILPIGKNYIAINLFGIVFAKAPCSEETLSHEYIHTLQMREMLYIGFYLWYVIEWIIRLLSTQSSYKAYRAISFEREAYSHSSESDYPKRRKPYSWIKYIR